jgi:prepilin-type N-terminal cleavage/methylation domain-containing protein
MNCRGFSLVETLIGATIMAVAVGALAHLATAATRSTQSAHALATVTLLAHDKLEELRAEPVLGASPPGTLHANVAGYCDFLDARGRKLAAGSAPPSGTAYVRRWSVEVVPAAPHDTVVLQAIAQRRGASERARLVTAKAQGHP